MTVKISKAGSPIQYYAAPDASTFNMPAGPGTFTISFVLTLDGDTAGAVPQYILSTGALGEAQSFHVAYAPGGMTSTQANRILIYRNTGTTPSIATTTILEAGKSYVFFITQSSAGLSVYSCLPLAAAPVDESAIVDEKVLSSNSVLYDAPRGMVIGARADDPVTSARLMDNSIGRIFCVPEVLTKAEMAQLAYGKTIRQIGKTPTWEIGLDTDADYAAPFVKYGSPTTSTVQPAFGYNAPVLSAPIITGKPVITGTAEVGQTLSYTPGSVSGGTSTRSEKWYISGTPRTLIGESPTIVVRAGDASKQYEVDQIQANATAPDGVSATSDPVTIAAAPVAGNTVTALAMLSEWMYPRTGNSANLSMSGAYTGATTPTSIQYALFAADGVTQLKGWTAITGAVISGGSWSANVSVPEGGMYRRQVRTMDGATVLAYGAIEVELFGVSILGYGTGSSSAEYRFSTNSGTSYTPLANVRKAEKNAGWSRFTSNGAAILEANAIAAKTGIPVGYVNCGASSTTLNGTTGWLKTNSPQWVKFVDSVAQFGKPEFILWTGGSNDASAGIVVSAAQHAENLRELFRRMREVVGNPNLHIIISGMNRRFAGSSSGVAVTDEQANFIHEGELIVGSDPNVTLVQTLDLPVLLSDGTHLTVSGFAASANRNGAVLAERLYGGGAYWRGPRLVRVNVGADGLSGTAAIEHSAGTDITPATGISGFTAVDASGNPVTVTADRASATQIALTFSATPAKVGYLATANPAVAGQMFDNATTALPMRMSPMAAVTSLGMSAAPLGIGAFASVGAANVKAGALAMPLGVQAIGSTSPVSVRGGARAVPTGISAYAQIGTVSASVRSGVIATPVGVGGTARVGAISIKAGAHAAPGGVAVLAQVGFVSIGGGQKIDVSKISPARIVVFEGSGSRVTPFDSTGSRVVVFEGTGSNTARFE